MKQPLKYVGLGVISFLGGFGAYAYLYKEKLDKVIEGLKFDVNRLDNFSLNFQTLGADVYLQAKNTVAQSITLNTQFVKLDTLEVYDKTTNKLLAISDLNLTEIVLQANGVFHFPKVSVQIPLITGALIALNTITNNTEDFKKRLRFELTISALGYQQIIHF